MIIRRVEMVEKVTGFMLPDIKNKNSDELCLSRILSLASEISSPRCETKVSVVIYE